MLGVLGFFYDASFETGSRLASDDLAGILLVNGWRNVIYLLTGLAALGFASRAPRLTALVLGVGYLVLGIWGLIVTERDIGDIVGVLPLADEDNMLHLALGGLGLASALLDPGRPKLRLPALKLKLPTPGAKQGAAAKEGGPATRRRPRADPRPGGGA